MQITLRPGERLYLNGAVLKADRKVCLELMNEAVFLLETHVMSVEKATTPIRQLYFVVQMMLMAPQDAGAAQTMFNDNLESMKLAYRDRDILSALGQVATLVAAKRHFEALKALRSLFALDDALMAKEQLALAS